VILTSFVLCDIIYYQSKEVDMNVQNQIIGLLLVAVIGLLSYIVYNQPTNVAHSAPITVADQPSVDSWNAVKSPYGTCHVIALVKPGAKWEHSLVPKLQMNVVSCERVGL